MSSINSDQSSQRQLKSPIYNRLQKNLSKLQTWAQRNKFEAYRIYDRDIPEYPYIVDQYKDSTLIYDKSDERIDSDPKKAQHFDQLIEAIKDHLGTPDDKIVIKRREKQKGESQYEKLGESHHEMIVREAQAEFIVNLHDYLDTGLFLDHRPMRYRIYKMSRKKSVLNLFCYTGSVSVMAALGGGRVTSVDMSATYLEWAQKNFEQNRLNPSQHDFIRENALEYLASPVSDEKFDIIFLDPPTFSNSKKMTETFEIEKDQEFLVNQCMARLAPGGILFFSGNKRKFQLSDKIRSQFQVKDITPSTIPQDFHDQKIHFCFEISK
jgi:23S rRNA (cytosine1962-C5)-methyltransferase